MTSPDIRTGTPPSAT